MTFTLDRIVPWGRTFDEYRAMFGLSAADLEGRILGCGDGPASFNAELTGRGGRVVSVDPLYAFGRAEVAQRIEESFDDILEQANRNREQFIWTRIASVDELGRARRRAMTSFLDDYRQGDERYIDASLPALPFGDKAFDIALCSHFLFLYSRHLDIELHIASLLELCRVAAEVRVFPLVGLDAERSGHLDTTCSALEHEGHRVSIERVDYEFQKGANEMLRIIVRERAPPSSVGC